MLSLGNARESKKWQGLQLEPLEQRALLSGIAGVGSATPAPATAPLGATDASAYVRKNQSTLTQSEKDAFVNAVKALKAIYNPGSTIDVYDQFVLEHSDAFASGQAHGGPAFLAWHREYLLQFEQMLQSVDPGVTIPYWDFTVDNSPTSSLWADNFLGGNGDPAANYVVTKGPFKQGQWALAFDGPDLRRSFGLLIPTLPGPADVDAAFAVPTYDTFPFDVGSPIDQSFRNNVEGFNHPTGEPEIHNRVHGWVGGSMAIQYSPNDPVFWLLHADIDRIWAQWQAQSGLDYAPEGGAAPGHNLYDPMSPFGVAPVDVLDHRALGYRYDTEPANAPPPGGGRTAPPSPPGGYGWAAQLAGHGGHSFAPAGPFWLAAPGGAPGLLGEHGGHPLTGGMAGAVGGQGGMEGAAPPAAGLVYAGRGGAEHLPAP